MAWDFVVLVVGYQTYLHGCECVRNDFFMRKKQYADEETVVFFLERNEHFAKLEDSTKKFLFSFSLSTTHVARPIRHREFQAEWKPLGAGGAAPHFFDALRLFDT